MLASKQAATNPSYDEQLRDRIGSILGSDLESVREIHNDYAQDLDKLVESVVSYLTRDKAAQRLTAEMRGNKSEANGQGQSEE